MKGRGAVCWLFSGQSMAGDVSQLRPNLCLIFFFPMPASLHFPLIPLQPISPLPASSASSDPQPSPLYFSTSSLLVITSSHTVTSFLLPVRSPCTPPPPPGMKCSCSMVFCLLLAKAIRRALGWPPVPAPPWESQPPCMPIPDMATELRSWSWPDVGWEFILIMWWRSMEGVTQMFCCDWAFWWWLSRPIVGTIPIPGPLSPPPTIRPIVIKRSSKRSGDTRSLSWDLEPEWFALMRSWFTMRWIFLLCLEGNNSILSLWYNYIMGTCVNVFILCTFSCWCFNHFLIHSHVICWPHLKTKPWFKFSTCYCSYASDVLKSSRMSKLRVFQWNPVQKIDNELLNCLIMNWIVAQHMWLVKKKRNSQIKGFKLEQFNWTEHTLTLSYTYLNETYVTN